MILGVQIKVRAANQPWSLGQGLSKAVEACLLIARLSTQKFLAEYPKPILEKESTVMSPLHMVSWGYCTPLSPPHPPNQPSSTTIFGMLCSHHKTHHACHLLEVSRDLSGLSSELDFFLPRFIRLLSFSPDVPFFLTSQNEERNMQ